MAYIPCAPRPTYADGKPKSLVRIAKEQGKIFGWVTTSSACHTMNSLRTETALDLSKPMELRRPTRRLSPSDEEYIHVLLLAHWQAAPAGSTIMISLPKGTAI